MPGVGKTTIAVSLRDALARRGLRSVVLDGDEMRARLSPELGFERRDRDLHVMRVAFVAKLIADAGAIPIVALVSPYRDTRERVRGLFRRFVEVYLHCPIEVLRERDPKGLYRAAEAGTVKRLT